MSIPRLLPGRPSMDRDEGFVEYTKSICPACEVNTGCNLDCPICFADSGHQPDGFSLTLDQVAAGLDAFVRSEGHPEAVMFSGGEPTIHPLILEFVQLATDKGVKLVTLNTNGI